MRTNSHRFDYLVIGGGSAGAAVASRLSEDPAIAVLLLEAGPARPGEISAQLQENVDTPAKWFLTLGSEIDWKYRTIPQAGLEGRCVSEPRGRCLGGTSNLYLMMHVRGAPEDFDGWAANGCPGWAYRDLLPYFERVEVPEDGAKSPPVGIAVADASRHTPNPTSAAFIEACKELGFPQSPNFTTRLDGVGWHRVNIRDGLRHGTFRAYLEPALRRPNLTVYTMVRATKLLFEGRRCVGVRFERDGAEYEERCREEVILAAGAIESPHLLLLSGIGPAAQLQRFGIPVVADLLGVGENFHNHVLTGVIREAIQPVPPGQQNLSESALFLKSRPDAAGPDLQLGFVHVPFDIAIGTQHPNSISILPGVVQPASRGWVRLASANPLDPPLLNPNYLAAPEDVARLIAAVRWARRIFAARAFAEWVGEELLPGPAVTDSDADLERFVRARADSYHHQAGSCKMGTDPMAVVDPELRVRNVEGLRIADASVMPSVPSGNCHAAILVIAERAADLAKLARSRAARSPEVPQNTVWFSHVGLNCQDPAAQERFYSRHFGFRRARIVPLPDGGQIVFLKAGFVYLELFKTEKNRPVAPPTADGYPFTGLRHLAFQVDDVEGTVASLTADGATVTVAPQDFGWAIPGWKSAWVADPEGNILEISQGYVDQAKPAS